MTAPYFPGLAPAAFDANWQIQKSQCATRPFGPRTRLPSDVVSGPPLPLSPGPLVSVGVLGQAPVQCVTIDVSQAVATILQMPAAPWDQDVVWIKLIGASVVSPAQVNGRTNQVEDPTNPGSYVTPPALASLGVNAGATFAFSFDAFNKRWTEYL